MFDLHHARLYFELLRARFGGQQEALNRLDSVIGDGDHGFTASRAFTAAEQASRGDFADLGALFDAAAEAMAENAGGAFGPLMGAFFAEGGRVFAGLQSADLGEMQRFLSGGMQALEETGGARPGEKTLLDALAPAVAALQTAAGLEEGLALAASAARNGAEDTRHMVAAQGRARFVGERSLGHVDPGAVSMSLLLAALGVALQGIGAPPPGDAPPAFTPPPGKLVNHPDDMVAQDLEGLALAYPGLVRLAPEGILVRAHPKQSGRVGLAIGHGGGHTPSMGGFVGPGLLDADACGPVFTCASGLRIAAAIRAADRGAGVALLVSNHSGDVLNARLGLRRARQEGVQVQEVVLGDDIATAPRSDYRNRRGLGGLLFALKTGGAAAEAGLPLAEVIRLLEKTNQRTATLAAAVRPPTHPATGKALFELPAGQIEVGTGVHGEAGVYRGAHLSADDLIDLLLERLLDDLQPFNTGRFLAFINGAGGTSRMELHILYRRLHHNLTARGLEISAGVVDSFFTTQEMGGISLSLCALDDELAGYWQAPACGPCFRWPAG